mmetsp:Transcript_62672/g.177965  ORF Transcript_62672/g.177965 Transcript_62672/m.177965 type:complete len:470 (-) Transcript_62672:46-1455(-)
MAQDTAPVEPPGPSEDSRWRPVFDAALRQILAEYEGHDPKVRGGMESGMRKLFENPYHVELGVLGVGGCGHEPLSLEEAHRVVFFPRLSDMRYYVAAFSRETLPEMARREMLMKFKLLSVFYTLHRKDGALVDRFMHLGGLQSLVALLTEENNVIQSQAVELLMEMLSPMMTMPKASSARQGHLHHQVFLCLRSGAFWRNFAKIVGEPHELFPKSHAHGIRILGGAVGWLRPEEGEVPQEGAAADVQEAAEALQRFLDGGRVPPELRGLTEDLLQELLDVPLIRDAPLSGADLEAAREALFAPTAVAREDAAHAWQALRRLGNEAFGAGLVWPAEAAYRLALAEGAAAVPASEASLLHSNRALALLKAGHPAEAAEAGASALELDRRNAKAAYRRAQALLQESKHTEGGAAVASAQSAVEAAELASSLEPRDQKVAELLQQARRHADELGPAACSEPAAACGESLEAMD